MKLSVDSDLLAQRYTHERVRFYLKVKCPACGAPPGYMCMTKSGHPTIFPHKGRVERKRALAAHGGAR